MDTLAFITVGFFTCFILWVMTSSLGFRLGLIVGAVVLAVVFGGYYLFFASAFSLFDALSTK